MTLPEGGPETELLDSREHVLERTLEELVAHLDDISGRPEDDDQVSALVRRERSSVTETPDRWPQTAQLILLAFSDDPDIAHLAAQELLNRIDLPAIPLALDDGRRRIIRREAAPWS